MALAGCALRIGLPDPQHLDHFHQVTPSLPVLPLQFLLRLI